MTKTKEDAIGSYLSHFRAHVVEVEDYLNGRQGSPLPPSFVSHTGYWTSLEKDAFFHALSLYSRLRPDLIAAAIRTKTTLDVCAYIDLLEQVSLDNLIPSSSLITEMDAAREMSDTWINWEEENALKLTSEEPTWERQAKERASSQVVDSQPSHLTKVDNTFSDDQEAIIQSLRSIHLAVLEHMLRCREEDLSQSQQKNGSCTPVQIRKEHETGPIFQKPVTDFESHRYMDMKEAANFPSTKDETSRRSRIKSNFSAVGINAEFLNDTGLGLFRLDALGRMMKCNEATGASISADTIRFLGVVVSEFICKVVHHTLVSREQERKAKADTKAWGHLQLIGATQVKTTLQSMGLSRFSDDEEFIDVADTGENNILWDKINQDDTNRLEMSSRPEWCTTYINLSVLSETSSRLSPDNLEESSTVMFDEEQEEAIHEGMDEEDKACDVTYEDFLWSTTSRTPSLP